MIYRNMTEQELETCLGWAQEEGWNPGLEDARAFFAADPDGFFVAETEGRLAACISVVNHSADQAFLGLYICRPQWRGQGVGFGLWQAALKHAGTRTVGLDGVPDQQENYRRSGFAGDGQTVRFMGALPRGRKASRRAENDDLAQILPMDSAAAGYGRSAYARAWFATTDTRQTQLLEVGGQIRGFATFRQCHEGVKIGPVQAQTEEDIITLLQSCPDHFPEGPFFVDTAAGSPLAEVLEGMGFAPVFSTARMYRGTPPQPCEPKFFGVMTLELG